MTIKIHQRQLTGLVRQFPNETPVEFTAWLEQNIGRFGQDWGRVYSLSPLDSSYGCTWWFKRKEDAILTLLSWA
jgi:hypothetical protein